MFFYLYEYILIYLFVFNSILIRGLSSDSAKTPMISSEVMGFIEIDPTFIHQLLLISHLNNLP
jgi:hypothetical protein